MVDLMVTHKVPRFQRKQQLGVPAVLMQQQQMATLATAMRLLLCILLPLSNLRMPMHRLSSMQLIVTPLLLLLLLLPQLPLHPQTELLSRVAAMRLLGT